LAVVDGLILETVEEAMGEAEGVLVAVGPAPIFLRISPIRLIDPCMPTTAAVGVTFAALTALVMSELPLPLVNCADRDFLGAGRVDTSVADARLGDNGSE